MRAESERRSTLGQLLRAFRARPETATPWSGPSDLGHARLGRADHIRAAPDRAFCAGARRDAFSIDQTPAMVREHGT